MRICPNLSDPNINAQWEALVQDPDIGKFEAMREFLEAEKQERAIGTPEQVKEKLVKREEPLSEYSEEFRRSREKSLILKKSNDPVYDDPDTLMGQAVLS